jgi:hypothetical protein
MKKYLVITVICMIIFITSLSGCNDIRSDEEKIIGLWERKNFDLEQTWEFTIDKNIIISNTNLTVEYWFDDNYLFTYYPEVNYVDQHEYFFNNNGNKLTLHLIGEGGVIDHDTGEVVDLENSSIITDYIFNRVK